MTCSGIILPLSGAGQWTDGSAFDDDPEIKATVAIRNISAHRMIGIDVMNSFEQPLVVNREGNDIVVRDLLIKDYPIFLRLVP